MKGSVKKSLTVIFSLVLSLALGISSSALASTQPRNWYCVNNNEHKAPRLDAQMKFIEDYDCYYADTSAVEKEKKVIYLTFDAGYENGNVAKILETLKKHNAKGAFFVLENLIRKNGELIKQMISEGHTVCNHTANHPDMSKITDKRQFSAQLTELEQLYKELTGQDMAKIYRPPQGRFTELNLQHAKELGYKTVFWSFAYADWDNNAQMSHEKAKEKILSHAHPGEIMLLHPTSKTNAEILDSVLSALEKEGYTFASIEELWK